MRKIPVYHKHCTCRQPKPLQLLLWPGPVCGTCRSWIGHPFHKCMACSGDIYPFQEELAVPFRRGPGVRYRHADDDGCRADIRTAVRLLPDPGWPRRSGPRRAEHEQKLLGA